MKNRVYDAVVSRIKHLCHALLKERAHVIPVDFSTYIILHDFFS